MVFGFFRESAADLRRRLTSRDGSCASAQTTGRARRYISDRTTVPRDSPAGFFTYLRYLIRLHEHPEWYNALTKNCTTALNRKIDADLPDPRPWNYQLLLNGTLDALLYERGRLVTGGLAFPALKEQAHINEAARAADADADFAARIRVGRVGF